MVLRKALKVSCHNYFLSPGSRRVAEQIKVPLCRQPVKGPCGSSVLPKPCDVVAQNPFASPLHIASCWCNIMTVLARIDAIFPRKALCFLTILETALSLLY